MGSTLLEAMTALRETALPQVAARPQVRGGLSPGDATLVNALEQCGFAKNPA
jgi:hypothetical protein